MNQPSLKLDEFKKKFENDKNKIELDLALQSFAKRCEYAKYYFDEFNSISLKDIWLVEGTRIAAEAHIVAYIANLHAMFDSFPFVIYLALSPLKYKKKGKDIDIDRDSCGWGINFLKSIKETYPNRNCLATQFKGFMDNHTFRLLQNNSNRNKHKFVPKIKWTPSSLEISLTTGKKHEDTYHEVTRILEKWHNDLVPKLIELFNTLASESPPITPICKPLALWRSVVRRLLG
jgi:hypothetical protein